MNGVKLPRTTFLADLLALDRALSLRIVPVTRADAPRSYVPLPDVYREVDYQSASISLTEAEARVLFGESVWFAMRDRSTPDDHC